MNGAKITEDAVIFHVANSVTIVARKEEDGKVRAGVAVLNAPSGDKYSRERGRTMAYGRLVCSRPNIPFRFEGKTIGEVLRSISQELSEIEIHREEWLQRAQEKNISVKLDENLIYFPDEVFTAIGDMGGDGELIESFERRFPDNTKKACSVGC